MVAIATSIEQLTIYTEIIEHHFVYSLSMPIACTQMQVVARNLLQLYCQVYMEYIYILVFTNFIVA